MSVLQYTASRCPRSINNASKTVYTVTSSFPPGKTRPKSYRREKISKRDIKDTMQHGTLINIVAAVNMDLQGQSGSKSEHNPTFDSLNTTMEAISNFVLPRDKTVSIPQPKQRVFNMPEATIQRKPVYYKHSADQEVRRESRIRLFEEGEAYRLKLKTVKVVERRQPKTRQSGKHSPASLKTMDNMFIKNSTESDMKDQENPLKPKSASSQDSRSQTRNGVRRLGNVKMPTCSRQVRELPKCDAVDLLEPTSTDENDDPAKSVLDDSRKLIPSNTPNSSPYIRTKSLPVIFPTRSSARNLTRSESVPQPKPPLVFKDRPLSQSLRLQTPISMYNRLMSLPNGSGYDTLSINNGFNQIPDIMGTANVNIETRNCLRKSSVGSSVRSGTRTVTTPKINRGTINMLRPGRPRLKQVPDQAALNRAKIDLHVAVQRVMSGKSTASTAISDSTAFSLQSRKSCLTSKSGIDEMAFGEQRSTKKVQFISSSSDTSSEFTLDKIPVRSGSGTIRTPIPMLRSYSPGIKPMSAHELLRFQQKILPVNLPTNDSVKSFYPASPGITIQSLYRPSSELSGLSLADESEDEPLENFQNDNISNSKVDNVVESEETQENIRGDKTDEELENNTTSDDDSTPELSANVEDRLEYYKLVKAVDLHTYEGFEHKKMRRSSSSSRSKEIEPKKSHYVKVRLS